MRFGNTLKNSTYAPWKDNYIDYAKLKKLLREQDSSRPGSRDRDDEDTTEWTEQDEETFVQELINVQLDKVNSFQVDTYKSLRDRTSECESRLEPLVVPAKAGDQDGKDTTTDKNNKAVLEGVLKELDGTTKEINELEKFSRINFTGFLKAAKKHDRKRGSRYRVRPLLRVRLQQLPFNSEDYSPLLYRLSTMYSYARQSLNGDSQENGTRSFTESRSGRDTYTSHKFWVHSDNLLEVKTYILRRLPVLVYNLQTSKMVDAAQNDPTITSLYFDNPKFDLYTQKVNKADEAGSLRLRWSGQLKDKPEIFLEKKIISSSDDSSKEVKFQIKEKYIQPFLKGEYKMEKAISKLEERHGADSDQAKVLKKNVDEIQALIKDNQLEPVLRANYTRTAFQIPGDDRVRVSLDTELALIREDSLDPERPCRDPEEWHRVDIDDAEMEFPFASIKKGEISRFPHGLLEIKVKDGGRKRQSEWLTDLMSSHLVKEAPRFSKFVHGVAQLFEDYVNSFPFWLSELDTDIRRDPETAFQQEQEKNAKRAEDEFAVGSFLGSKPSPAFKPKMGLPAARAFPPDTKPSSLPRDTVPSQSLGTKPVLETTVVEGDSDDDGMQAEGVNTTSPSGLRSLFPTFSTSRYAQAHRQGHQELPPGVKEPGFWMKDSGPVRVEAKVWLANQRTFIKWQHIAVLLASLSLGLYNAAGLDNGTARALAVVYTGFAVFAGAWGWWMYIVRSRLIQERSGKDFDNIIGPIIVCVGLTVALCLNFGFKVSSHKSSYPE